MPKKKASDTRPKVVIRSFRVDDNIWERLRARSEEDGVPMSYVLTTLADGYGRGLIDLPRTQLVYAGRVSEPE